MNWGRLMKRLHRARGMPLDVDGSKRQEQLVRLVLEHPDVAVRSEEHTSELQSPCNLVCRLLLEKKKHLNRTLIQAPDQPQARRFHLPLVNRRYDAPNPHPKSLSLSLYRTSSMSEYLSPAARCLV